jgi:hypothetical protein
MPKHSSPRTSVPVIDTGYSANTTTADKTVVLANYTNGLNGTMVTALNTVSTGTGTALSGGLDVVVLLVKKVAALEATLAAGKFPNA